MGGCCGESEEEDTRHQGSTSPMKRRNVCCTDILFLCIFIAFWGGMGYIAVTSYMYGDWKRLYYGYDSFGNTCNKDNSNSRAANASGLWNESSISDLVAIDTTNKEHVFFFDIMYPSNSIELCVTKCPERTLSTKQDVKDYALQENGTRLCRYDIDPDEYLIQDFSRKGPCPALPVYKMVQVMNRCVPDPTVLQDIWDLLEKINGHNNTGLINYMNVELYYTQIMGDVLKSYKEMLAFMGISIVIAVLMVLCIRFLASVVVWIIVALAALGSIAGTGVLWYEWYKIKEGISSKNADENIEVPVFSIDISNKDAFLGFAICASCFTILLLLVLFVMRKRIALVVTLFHETGKCLAAMPLLLIQPLWTFIIVVAFLAGWMFIMACVYTTGDAVLQNDGTNKQGKGFDYLKWEQSWEQELFFWYHIVGLIWTTEFMFACQQMVISGAVALWFFASKEDRKKMSCTVCTSTGRLIMNHLGSVAFGSFIITLVKIPRYILMYIEHKCNGSQSEIAKLCIKCCICCLWCLEKALKFLNANAYTVIAIEGKNFCSAAGTAFKIIASNILRVTAINSVGDFVLFLGKLAVSSIVCIMSVFWFKNRMYDGEYLYMYAVPVALVTLFSYLVAHCFLSIYEMVVDTMLLCFCEDCKLNDGSPEKPYFMSDSLMKYVKNSSAALKTRRQMQTAPEDPPPDYEMSEVQHAQNHKRKGSR